MKKISLILICMAILVINISCSMNNEKGEITKESSEIESITKDETTTRERKIEEYTNVYGKIDIYKEIQANPKEDFVYHLNSDNNIVIDEYIGKDALLVFPNEIDGKAVTEIGKLEKNNYVTDIQIGVSVKKIADYAFSEWEKLKQVSIFVDKEYIGNGAFAKCPNLELAAIGDADKLGEGIFYECNKLKEVRVEGNINILPKDTFAGCVALEDVRLSLELESIEEGCFDKCASIQSIYLSKNVNSIKSFPKNANMIAYKDSYAYQYAKENGIQIELNDADLY
ncbi:MAG: leucine-rich repeat domain-containing protein [Lachnospiraceae bacterium]|nr:leucine-rich repeat domain-containing protein [Lachnospiraceae bacterium]